MSFESVSQYFEQVGLGNRVKHFDESSATVLEAAHALDCEPEHIAKTMSFLVGDEPILIVMAGDDHSAVELSLSELNNYTHADHWVDVCKGWQNEAV